MAGRREPDDIPIGDNIWMASPARALIDNSTDHPGQPNQRITRATRTQWHDHIVRLTNTTRPDRVDELLRQVIDRGTPRRRYRVLDFAQRWVSGGDWSTVDAGLSYVHATNALIDARNAENDRVRLEVPAWSATGSPTGSGAAAPQLRGQASP